MYIYIYIYDTVCIHRLKYEDGLYREHHVQYNHNAACVHECCPTYIDIAAYVRNPNLQLSYSHNHLA